MALPSQFNNTLPAGSSLPSTLDNQIRANALAVEDIFGVPDQTNISIAAMAVALVFLEGRYTNAHTELLARNQY